MLVFARAPQCALFERGSLHVVLKGPMVTLLMSNKQSREKEPEPLGSLHPDSKPVCCALQRQDEKGRHQPCRWLFRDRRRAEHCTAGSLQGMASFLPREPGTVCVSSEMTPQTTMPPAASTSQGTEPPLLPVPIRFKGSKLTEHNTQHLGKYSGNNTSFLLESKTKEGSPEFYVATNNS